VKYKNSKLAWLRSKIPTRESLENNRALSYIKPYFTGYDLWHWSRRGVTLGISTGIFFGLIIPTFQIPLAIIAAIIVRCNVAVAAACTFVTNPFTFPPIYFFAFKLGKWLLGYPAKLDPAIIEAPEKSFYIDFGSITLFFESITHSLYKFGLPLFTGLFIFALLSSIISYIIINNFWISFVRQRRSKSLQARAEKNV